MKVTATILSLSYKFLFGFIFLTSVLCFSILLFSHKTYAADSSPTATPNSTSSVVIGAIDSHTNKNVGTLKVTITGVDNPYKDTITTTGGLQTIQLSTGTYNFDSSPTLVITGTPRYYQVVNYKQDNVRITNPGPTQIIYYLNQVADYTRIAAKDQNGLGISGAQVTITLTDFPGGPITVPTKSTDGDGNAFFSSGLQAYLGPVSITVKAPNGYSPKTTTKTGTLVNVLHALTPNIFLFTFNSPCVQPVINDIQFLACEPISIALLSKTPMDSSINYIAYTAVPYERSLAHSANTVCAIVLKDNLSNDYAADNAKGVAGYVEPGFDTKLSRLPGCKNRLADVVLDATNLVTRSIGETQRVSIHELGHVNDNANGYWATKSDTEFATDHKPQQTASLSGTILSIVAHAAALSANDAWSLVIHTSSPTGIISLYNNLLGSASYQSVIPDSRGLNYWRSNVHESYAEWFYIQKFYGNAFQANLNNIQQISYTDYLAALRLHQVFSAIKAGTYQ